MSPVKVARNLRTAWHQSAGVNFDAFCQYFLKWRTIFSTGYSSIFTHVWCLVRQRNMKNIKNNTIYLCNHHKPNIKQRTKLQVPVHFHSQTKQIIWPKMAAVASQLNCQFDAPIILIHSVLPDRIYGKKKLKRKKIWSSSNFKSPVLWDPCKQG